jgi:hypothetical protein
MIGSALAGPATVGGQHLQPRASVGIHTGTGDAWHILACADAAMYTAKETGGNHILTYDADRDGIPDTDGTRPASRPRDQQPAWSPSVTPWAVTSAPAPAVRTPAHPAGPRITLYWSARVSYNATFDLAELTGLTELSHPDGRLDLDMLAAAPAGPALDRLLSDHEIPQNSDGAQERQIDTVHLPRPCLDATSWRPRPNREGGKTVTFAPAAPAGTTQARPQHLLSFQPEPRRAAREPG